MSLTRVAVVVPPRPALFELGVVHQVLGVDRTDDGVPPHEFRACTERPGEPLPTTHGITLTCADGLEAAAAADLVVAPAYDTHEPPSEAVLDVFRAAHARGAWVLSVCSGSFLLGYAGLLDGRRSTTHWRHTAELASRFPATTVDPDVLFVEDDRVVTSAGTAAGIDACLHHVRCELGAAVANRIARRMVVPPQRDGGQRQYIDQPIPVRCSEGFAPHLDWILGNLEKPHTVAALAARAHMSMRTFARRFVEETGRTPIQWVTDQRVLYARTLLEETDLDVDRIAERSGFGTATLLRHHFRRIIGVTPSDYRRRFACGTAGSNPAAGEELATG